MAELAGFLLDSGRLQGLFMRRVAAVVTFHRVAAGARGHPIAVSAEEFRGFCRFFRRHFDVISLGTLLDRLAAGADVGGSLVVTFDDGYRDNFEVAVPILESCSLPATFFVATGYIGSARVAPWDEGAAPPPRWMDWDHIRDLRSRGFEIGAHTVNHIDLAAAPSEQVRDELKRSRADLEEVLGERVDLFSYPFGGAAHIDDRVRELVREAGFRCCASCHGGFIRPGTDPMSLNRIPVGSWYSSPRHLAATLALGRT